MERKDLNKIKNKPKSTYDRGIMAATIMNAYIKYSEDNPFENIEAVVNLTDKLINKLNQTI
jgi:hypothetical protein